ncbi:ATP citrate lyase subunit 1 [Rhodotorula kratochvilovae]
MAAKPVREFDAKLLVAYHLARAPTVGSKVQAREGFTSPEVKVAQVSLRSPSP